MDRLRQKRIKFERKQLARDDAGNILHTSIFRLKIMSIPCTDGIVEIDVF